MVPIESLIINYTQHKTQHLKITEETSPYNKYKGKNRNRTTVLRFPTTKNTLLLQNFIFFLRLTYRCSKASYTIIRLNTRTFRYPCYMLMSVFSNFLVLSFMLCVVDEQELNRNKTHVVLNIKKGGCSP